MAAKEEQDLYNATTNTFAGITTPSGQQNIAATDSLAEAVEGMMDNLQKSIAPAAPSAAEDNGQAAPSE